MLFFFPPRYFFNEQSFNPNNHFSISEKYLFGTIEPSLAVKFKGVESHFSFPPCLTPFSTTPAVPLSHSSNLSPSSPFLSFHQGSRGMLITERRRYRSEESAVARIFTRPANVNTLYIYIHNAPSYALSWRRKNPRKTTIWNDGSGITDNRAIITRRTA